MFAIVCIDIDATGRENGNHRDILCGAMAHINATQPVGYR